MTTTPFEAAVEETVRVAVLELLVNPEYGTSFLSDIMKDHNVTVNDDTLEAVDKMVDAKLKEFAKSIVSELNTERNVAVYSSLV